MDQHEIADFLDEWWLTSDPILDLAIDTVAFEPPVDTTCSIDAVVAAVERLLGEDSADSRPSRGDDTRRAAELIRNALALADFGPDYAELALAALDEAARADRASPHALRERAEILLDLDRRDEAEASARAALALASGDLATLLVAAGVFTAAGNGPSALALEASVRAALDSHGASSALCSEVDEFFVCVRRSAELDEVWGADMRAVDSEIPPYASTATQRREALRQVSIDRVGTDGDMPNGPMRPSD